ncbi:MAG: ABC transporter permease [Clostridiaceae bacterium]
MKAFSPFLYSKRNKRKVFASLNAVIIAVSFLFVLYAFMQSMIFFQERKFLYLYDNIASVSTYGANPIEKEIIEKIKENENVETVIPANRNFSIYYKIPGIIDTSLAIPILEQDRDYFMDKLNIKVLEGRLPKEGLMEIAINKDIAINRKLILGDKVGDSVNKLDNIPGEYEIVGILDDVAVTSIMSVNDRNMPNYKNREELLTRGFYVFPKEDKKEAMDKYISSLEKDKVSITTKEIAVDYFNKSASSTKVIDVIAILSIVVMVLTVGSSKYAQYLNRKEELGVLNALGFNKSQILKRAFNEVVIVNLFGYILGIVLGIILSYLLAKGLWESCGVKGFLYTGKGIVIASFIPLFTILFSIIPINMMINKLDPIKMIEKN